MISIIKRNCPSCSSQSAEIELKPEIDPYANIELLPEYWRGFNEKKIFFHIVDANVAYYIVIVILITNLL